MASGEASDADPRIQDQGGDDKDGSGKLLGGTHGRVDIWFFSVVAPKSHLDFFLQH